MLLKSEELNLDSKNLQLPLMKKELHLINTKKESGILHFQAFTFIKM